MKHCSKCQLDKPARQFYPAPRNSSGRDNVCAACRSQAGVARVRSTPATPSRLARLAAQADMAAERRALPPPESRLATLHWQEPEPRPSQRSTAVLRAYRHQLLPAAALPQPFPSAQWGATYC